MDISINNLGGNSSPSVSSLISQLVSKRTQSLNSLLDQKSQIENSLAALQSGALGIGSINNSYSEQIASLQDTIDKLNEQYSINANKITTINSLKKSYSSTVSSLEKYIESLKNPNSANTDLDIYLDGNKVSSNNKVDVTINDKNTNVQEITLNVTQIATTSTLKSNVLLGGTATANTKITDLFAGIFDAANNSIKTNRQDLKESLRLRDLGVTSGSFNLGSAKITIDAENDTIGDLIQKIKNAGYNAQIETTSYDDNGEAVGRLLISGSDGKSVSITNQTTNFTSLMGLTVSEGNFYINGAEFTITADSTLGSLMKEINSASADNVGAKLEDGKLVFVASETGAVDINVEKGTSNFTNAIGFTVGGVMNQSNLVLGTDGSYITLTGQNTSVKLTDSVQNGKFTEGNFNLYYNTVDEHGKVSDELTKVIIEITKDDTVASIIEKIKNQTAGSYVDEEGNTVQTGLTAEVVNGQFVIRQVQKGAEFDISIEAGSSNFTNYVGMTTQVSNTTSKDAENSYILGTTVVPDSGFTEGSFIISTNKLSDDGKTALFETISAVIEVTSTDTAQTIADKITNAGLDLTASITEDGHFKIEQNNSGVDFDITVTAGGTDFTEKAGLTSNIINTGVLSPGSDVNQFTTLTGANSVTGSTAVGKGTFKINGVTVEIGAGTINSAIEDINSYSNQTGVNAYLKDGKVVLQANKTGADYSIYVEGGTSNFGSIAGFVSESQSAATAVIGQTGSKTTLTGAYDVTKDMQISAGTININGLNINIEAGTLENVIGQINKYSEETGVTASIKNGKFVLTNTENGDMSINVVDGSSNLAELTGITAYQTEVGREEILGATQTTMTASKTGLQKSNVISDSQIQINGQTINLSQDIGHAIDQINAYTNMTGVEAYLDTQGRFVLRNVKAGSHTINFKDISGDFTRVIGAASSSTSAGSSGQTGTKGAVMTGGMDGLTENTAIMGGGTLNIGGTTISLDGLKNIGEVIDKINSSGAMATASLNDYGQLVITGKEHGKNFDVSYTGNGNFGYVTGFGSYNIGSDATNNGVITGNNNVTEIGSSSSIPSQPSEPVYEYTATVLQGNRTVTGDTIVGNTKVSFGAENSSEFSVSLSDGDTTINDVINAINQKTSESGIKASLVNEKFTLTRVEGSDYEINSDIQISLELAPIGIHKPIGSTNFALLTGLGVFNNLFVTVQPGGSVVAGGSTDIGDGTNVTLPPHETNPGIIIGGGNDNTQIMPNQPVLQKSSAAPSAVPSAAPTGMNNLEHESSIDDIYTPGGSDDDFVIVKPVGDEAPDTPAVSGRKFRPIDGIDSLIKQGVFDGTFEFSVNVSDTEAQEVSIEITSSDTLETIVNKLNNIVSKGMFSILQDEYGVDYLAYTGVAYVTSDGEIDYTMPSIFGGTSSLGVALQVSNGGSIAADMTKTMGTVQVVSSGSAGSSSAESQVSEGSIIINDKVINISEGTIYDAVNTINAALSETGVIALINDYGQLVLKNSDGGTDNITLGAGTSNLWEVAGIDPAEHQGLLDYTEGGYSSLQGGRDVTGAQFGENGSITIKKGSESLKIDISAGESVQSIVNKINAADAGFKASLVQDGGKLKFKIESTTEGTDAVSVTVNSGDFGRVTGMTTYSSPGATTIGGDAGDKVVGGVGSISGDESGFSGGSFTITLGHDEADSNGGLVIGTSDVTDVGILTEEEALAQGYTIIKTAADLNNIRNDLDGKYVLMGDIDLSGYSNWTAIGSNSSTAFTGELNGNGYTIKNLNINSSSVNQGLFGYIAGGKISNLNLSNVNVKSTGSNVGALAGTAAGATISNVHVLSGSVTGSSNVGGLVGVGGLLLGSTIIQSSSAASVTSTSTTTAYVGGLVGTATSIGMIIKDSYATGSVTSKSTGSDANDYAGGLIGYISGSDGIIENSYATGTITTANNKKGGIVGFMSEGTLKNNYYKYGIASSSYGYNDSGTATGNVAFSVVLDSSWISSGFSEDIWDFFSGTGVPTLISQKPKDAEVTSGSIYINNTSISLSAGSINDAIDAINAKSSTTGVIASINSDGNVVFENKDGSSDNIALRVTATGSNFFSVAGIAVDNKGILNGGNNVITETEHLSESQAKAQGYTIIKTAADLNNIRNNLSGKYILMGDIDLSSYSNWTAIGTITSAFKGELNGNGYTIKNLTIDSSSDSQGLFGYVDSAEFRNLYLSNVDIKSSYGYVGALVGYVKDNDIVDIENVHVLSGSVTGADNVGGLVGYGNYTRISNSSSAASVTSTSTSSANAGGLVGYLRSSSSITNSYSTGSVTSKTTGSDKDDYAGGLVGFLGGATIIKYSYATGTLNSANNKEGALVGYMASGTLQNNYYKSGIATSSVGYKSNGTNTGSTSFSSVTDSTWINKGFSEDIWDFLGTGAPTLKPVTTEVYLEVSAGTIVINGVTINLTAGTMDDIVDQINAKSSSTGVAALINSSGKVELSNKNGSLNSISLTEGTSNFFEVAGFAAEKPSSIQLTEEEAKAQGYTIIKTAADLNNIRNDLDGKYILMGDIDLSGSAFTSIGTTTFAFTGELNGNGYTISNIQTTRGLFTQTDGAIISNLNIENIRANTSVNFVGALAGYAADTTITNVHVLSGSVTGGNGYVGGLIGGIRENSYTTISMSSSAADVNSTSTSIANAGGLVGSIANESSSTVIISNSYATGNVITKTTQTSTDDYAGGLVGYMGSSSLIENSYAAGTVTTTNNKRGGIVGFMYSGTVKNSLFHAKTAANVFGYSSSSAISTGNARFTDSLPVGIWTSRGFSEDIWDFSGTGAPTLKSALKPATETVTISITDSDTVDDVIQKLKDKGLDAEIVDGHVVINGYTSVESISGTSDFGKYVALGDGSISASTSSTTGSDGFYTYTGHAVEGLTDSDMLGKPIGGQTAGTIYVNGNTVNVAETDTVAEVMGKILDSLLDDGITGGWRVVDQKMVLFDLSGSVNFESGTSNFLDLVGLTQDGFSSETDIDIEDASVGFNRVTGSESGFELNDSIGALEDGTLTISQGSSSLTIDVSKYDTIQSLIDKINTSTDFEAGLDSQGRFYIQSKNESTTKISIDTAGSTNLDELLGLSGGSFSGSMSQDVGSDGYIKITGSVDLGTSSSAGKVTIPDKFAGGKTFTITGNTGASFTVNISNDMTISTLISKINASGKFTAGIDSDGYFYIQGKEGITDITFSGTSGLEDYLGLSDKSENISSGASQSTGKFDKYSTLTGTAVVNHNMTFSAGNFTLTVGSKSVEINVLDGESITSVINKINNSGLGVTASIQNDKFVITADNPGNISMSLKDGTSNFAELTGFISQGGSQIVSQDKGVLSTYTSANTAQSAQNAGISAGDFYVHLTDMNGNITDTAKITIGKNENIASIIEKINNCGLGVTASINDSGKMVITRNSSDTAGGVLVTKGSSDFTNKIGFTSGGYQAPSTIYGSQAVLTSVNPISTSQKFSNGDFIIVVEDNGIVNETSIDVFESDSIYDIIDRINNADIGVTASLNANNRLVITKDADTSDGSIGIKKGSSDFTTIFGFSSGGVFNGSHETGEAATHTVLVSNKLAVSGKATMASLGVTDGAFRINGVEIAIKSTDTIDDVIGRINSIFNSSIYDDIGVTAEYKNNQIVLTSKKASSNARIEIESGSTNFTEVVGFTNIGSRDNVVDMGQNAQFNIKIGDDEVGTDYDLALDLKDITDDNIYNGNNLIYLDADGKVVEHANNAAITIEIKETGETIIRIGQNVLDASINELNKFVGNFNKAMIASENEILSDDAEFAALINNIKAALTDDVADLRKIQQQMAEIGITVDIRGGTNSNMGTVRLYLDREKYTQAFYDDSQHVMDLLIGKETAVGVEDGVLTRLNNVLYPEVNNKNGYFNKVPRTLQAVQKELNREITRTTFQLNELKLAVSGQTGVGDGLAEYLAKLEEQYNFVNEAISNLNKQYASSVTRLILNQNNAGFNPIVT